MHRVRRRLGIPDSQPVQRQATRADIARMTPRMVVMRARGESYAAIAADVGMSIPTVRRVLKAEGVPTLPTAIPHGTPSAWQHHRCRCEVCAEARREYRRAEHQRRVARARITAEHGTQLAYQQGCRCDRCTEVMRRWTADRQAATVPGAHRHGRRWTYLEAQTAMRTDLTISEKAALIGRTHAAVDNWVRAYMRRPDDPYQVKPR